MTRTRVTRTKKNPAACTASEARRAGSRALMSWHVPLVDWLAARPGVELRENGRELAESSAAELASVIGWLAQGRNACAPLVVSPADVTRLISCATSDAPTRVDPSLALLGLWVDFLEGTNRWSGTTAEAGLVRGLIDQRRDGTVSAVAARPVERPTVVNHLGENRAGFQEELSDPRITGTDPSVVPHLLSLFDVSLGRVLAAEDESSGPNRFSAETVGRVVGSYSANTASADGGTVVEMRTTVAWMWWQYLDFLDETGLWEGVRAELWRCRDVVREHLPEQQRSDLDFMDEMEQRPPGAENAFLENALPVRMARALHRLALAGTPLPRVGRAPVPVVQEVARLLRRDSTVDEAPWSTVTWELLQEHYLLPIVGPAGESWNRRLWPGDDAIREEAPTLVADYVERIIPARVPSPSTARVVAAVIGAHLDGREFTLVQVRDETVATLPPGAPPEDAEEIVYDVAAELDRLVDDGLLLEQPTPSMWRVPSELRWALLKRDRSIR